MNLEKNKMEFGKNFNGFHGALYIYIYIYILYILQNEILALRLTELNK